ncbi:hypothetical protein GYMLUDRAFT_60416 [Collybiopsis luxurians FD-317 M1]|uniref:Uncharacterized protein n=1 Tax=Collybiopsis luxurians FD-317 M1 TaxID=944289 RepID=A0A0D0CT23_9AGAR|nr:hypothetical protein GYMLUDRAFT_60416 [Collybiopsis luxurians FD-317 M1]
MPAISAHQRVLRGAFKYARKLQERRRIQCIAPVDSGDEHESAPLDSDSNSDSSSLSSLSSISSVSSTSELEGRAGDSSSDDSDKEDQHYICHFHAVQAEITEILQTQVHFPNKVHKCSQLSLVLQLYKQDDPRHFW